MTVADNCTYNNCRTTLPPAADTSRTRWARKNEKTALALVICGRYLAGVSRRIPLKMPTKLRNWRVIIIRSKGEYLGSVEAPDRERAEAVAIKQFALDDDQRSRLLIRERP